MQHTEMSPNLEILFDDMSFPAARPEIIEHAKNKNAGREATNMLQGLPQEEFQTLNQLNIALAQIKPLPGQENQWSSHPSRDIPEEQDQVLSNLKGSGKTA